MSNNTRQGYVLRNTLKLVGYQVRTSDSLFKYMQPYENEGIKFRGYCYYHEQFTQSCIESGADGQLHLYYAAEPEQMFGPTTDKESQSIGEEIVTELSRQGLQTEWDGDPDQTILVNLHWRKRSHIRLPGSWRKIRLQDL